MSSKDKLYETWAPMTTPHPGQLLREMLEQRGWTQDELAVIVGSTRQTIQSIVVGKSNVSADMAVALAAAFGNLPEEWMRWDSQYRLSVTERDTSGVTVLAKCYNVAPIKDMVKRGWIPSTDDATEMEESLKKFFASDSLDKVTLHLAPRRTAIVPELSVSERAWCFRAKQLAASQIVEPFSEKAIKSAKAKLRKLAAYSKEARRVPKILAECGIRFVIVEPLPGVKIDGAAFWLEDGPVIAMSLRHDRIDGFWFTLMHEIAHIENGDAAIDPDLIEATKGIAVRLVDNAAERLADQQAADSLVSTTELRSFIQRVGPFYPTARIVQFANRMKIHPGIIVGQLHHRQELPYAQQREFLVKIRDVVSSTALTDGWNQMIAPNLL
ncbi:MAG: HigA family addiction module antidote protein [Acidobacteria bacterium]|nr:HigA family addiction module antidote protein [Acidobacteriota bacterium]MBS1867877.1 HigA family addiction module antidote protein [Acidobacteriota bacterium]